MNGGISVTKNRLLGRVQVTVLLIITFEDYGNIRYTCVNVKHNHNIGTVYPKKYAHGFCFAVLCCGYTLTDFPISIRLTSLALRQSNDCPSAIKATLMNMDKYFMWIHYERLHNHNKAKHNKTVCIFLGIYCTTPNSECVSAYNLKSLIFTIWISLVRRFIIFLIFRKTESQ